VPRGLTRKNFLESIGEKIIFLNCGGQTIVLASLLFLSFIYCLSLLVLVYLTLAKMLPYASFALTLAIGLSAAQSTTTVSLFLPNTDPQSLVASVIGTVSKTAPISCFPFCLPADLNFAGRYRNYLPHLLSTWLR
jgi:hypothetical protein